MSPDFDVLDPLLAGCGASCVYLVCHDGGTEAHARMFASAIVGGEDPATGSAVGALCAYLSRLGRGERVEVTQGVEMGRPSSLIAEMDGDQVRVGGDVVSVIEGTVSL